MLGEIKQIFASVKPGKRLVVIQDSRASGSLGRALMCKLPERKKASAEGQEQKERPKGPRNGAPKIHQSV